MRHMTTMGMTLGLLVLGVLEGAAQQPAPEAAERAAVAEARLRSRAALRAVTMRNQVLETTRLRALERELVQARRAIDRGALGARTAVRAVPAGRVREALRVAEEQARLEALRPPRAALRGVAAPTAPEAWLPQDPADSLYREARARLNGRRYEDAARLFAELRDAYPRSGYAGDAYYFEALARSRVGAQNDLRRALELLEAQQTRHPSSATVDDARALAVRIEGQLARRGDSRAAQAVTRAAVQAQECDDADQDLRATALSALLQMDPSRARPILQEVLRSRDTCSAELRAQAVFILAQQIGDEPDDATVELLLDLAHRNPDPNPEVREAAVFWLSQSGNEAAVDALVQILESGTATPELAEQAIFALGQSGSARARGVLRDYALDASADREMRANAIFWLGQQGGEEAGPFLRSLYDSLDDPELKERIFFAVAETSWDGRLAWLTARALDPNESIDVRNMALFWAGEAGLSPNEALRIYRTADDPELRQQAIFVLTQVAQEGEAVDALLEIARTEENQELRQQAIFWLGQSDDPRVVELLMEIVRGGGGGR